MPAAASALDVKRDDDVVRTLKVEGRWLREGDLIARGGLLRTLVPKRYFWEERQAIARFGVQRGGQAGPLGAGRLSQRFRIWRGERLRRRGFA